MLHEWGWWADWSGDRSIHMQLTAELLSKGQLLGKGEGLPGVTAGHAGLILKGVLKKV